MEEFTKKLIENLKIIIQEIETGTFSGVLIYSNYAKQDGWVHSIKGYAEDRLSIVDCAVLSMKNEPNKEARDWFFTQLYERVKYLRPIEINKAIV